MAFVDLSVFFSGDYHLSTRRSLADYKIIVYFWKVSGACRKYKLNHLNQTLHRIHLEMEW